MRSSCLIGLEGLSYRQTAAILGISEGTMRSRLTRGRDSLRRAMGVAEEFHQQAAQRIMPIPAKAGT